MSTNTVTNSTLSAARKRDEMLEPYEWKRSRTVLRREGASNRPDLVDYQIRFALEAEDAVQDTAGVTVTVMQGAKSESVKINSSVSQQDGGVVLSAALTGSDWQVGKAELTIRLSETEYDCCLPVSALHSDNGGDFVYSVEERNTILGLQNIVRKVYVEVVERNNELAALRNYTTGAPVVAATTKSLQEGARVRTAG